jgi:wyosine [tRNA(Phe)-imidazoG37] synthetase (radical SAM superfamily)
MKIDAPTDELATLINHPAPGYSVARVVEALEKFEGNFVLQTMFLRAPGFDSGAPQVVGPWMEIVRRLRPREVMVYTIDRPTPASELEPYTQSELQALVAPLVEEGFKIQVRGK